MEEALHDVPLYRGPCQARRRMARLSNETTIRRFRHLRERHNLAADMQRAVTPTSIYTSFKSDLHRLLVLISRDLRIVIVSGAFALGGSLALMKAITRWF